MTDQGRLFATARRRPRPAMFPCEECGASADIDLSSAPGEPAVFAWLCLDCRFNAGWSLYNPERAVIPF